MRKWVNCPVIPATVVSLHIRSEIQASRRMRRGLRRSKKNLHKQGRQKLAKREGKKKLLAHRYGPSPHQSSCSLQWGPAFPRPPIIWSGFATNLSVFNHGFLENHGTKMKDSGISECKRNNRRQTSVDWLYTSSQWLANQWEYQRMQTQTQPRIFSRITFQSSPFEGSRTSCAAPLW